MYSKISFTIFYLLISTASYVQAQCNVQKGKVDDDHLFYAHGKEVIFKNDDLENGALVALVRLVVTQKIAHKDSIKFTMLIDVGSTRLSKIVVPRNMSILFTDNSTLDLFAESMKSPSKNGEIYFERSTFWISTESYFKILNNSIKEILILDHRSNKKLICKPYKDILSEQAACIGSALQ